MASADKAARLTVDKVGGQLGLSASAVYKIPACDLPYYKLGPRDGRRVYDQADVDAYVKARRVEVDPVPDDENEPEIRLKYFTLPAEEAPKGRRARGRRA